MVTLGSSGIVNQIMSGFMITYSRAVRLGDFVRIGEVEGTVIHLGVLSTKMKTLSGRGDGSQCGRRRADHDRLLTTRRTEGVFTPTSVTIGYDAPWRQVHALLLHGGRADAGPSP